MSLRSPRRRYALLLHAPLLLLPLAALAPLILQGQWPDAHDGLRYFRLTQEFRDAFVQGNPYPRWLPELLGGWGYPTFVFYQPGFFFLSTLVSLVVPDTLLAIQITVLLLLVGGGAGAALLGRRLSGSVTTGAMAGLVFLLTPYVWVELLVRGDLSELAAMLATPWPLFFLLVTRDRVAAGRPSAAPLAATAVALASIPFFHPFVAVFFFPVFAAVAVALSFEGAKGHVGAFLFRAGLAMLLGAALASLYAYPAFVSREYVRWENALGGYFTAHLHVVEPGQLFSRRWGFGDSTPDSHDGMPMQLGLPHFLLAVLGTVVSWRRPSRWLLGAVYAAAVLVMTPMAAPLWQHEALRVVQFPWRALSVIAVLQAMAFAGAGPLLAKLSPRRAVIVLVAGMLLCIAWNPQRFRWVAPAEKIRATLATQREVDRRRMETWTARREFLPRTAELPPGQGPKPGEADLEIVEGGGQVVREGTSRHRFRFRVTGDGPRKVRLAQLWMPGWDVRVDGRRLSDPEIRDSLAPDGRIGVPLPPGDRVVEARYGAPPGQREAAVAAAAAILVGALFAFLERRRLSARAGAR